jgi:hypothetical protein
MSLTANKLERHNVRRESRSSTEEGQHSPSNSSFARDDTRSDAGSAGPSLASPRTARARSEVSVHSNGAEAVKVICRVRPFARRELEIQDDMNSKFTNEWEKMPLRSVVDMVDGKVTNFLDYEKGYSVRQSFNFDHSLWSIEPSQQDSNNVTAHQEDVYNIVGLPAVNNVWQGFNTCVFAYGQTGSGKTYTMMGTDDEPGLIPRICRALFNDLQAKKAEAEAEAAAEPGTVKEYRLEAKFLEIYNEKVKDLLWVLRENDLGETMSVDRENLKIRLVPGQGPQVVGLTTLQVKSLDDCINLIEEGTRNRSVAATKMNEESSRSHSIFRLTLTQTTTVLPTKQFEKPKHYHRTSTVSLIDLAGSERNKKTGAEGDRLKEAVAINKSLTTLKNVIDALVEQRAVVPYRDSTLTWLLSDNLGGNSKTFMIACVSPHLDNAEESLNTLRYAIRTQSVMTHATVNESAELKRMAKLRGEMEQLKAQVLDTGEDSLRSRADELATQMAVKKDEHDKQRQLVDILNDALAHTKELQFTAAYVNQFHIGINRRNENALRNASARLKQDVELLDYEVERLRKDVIRATQDRDTAAIEERVSRDRRRTVENEVEAFKGRAAVLEERKSALLLEDQTNTEKIDRKGPMCKAARNLAHVLAAYETHCCALALNRTVVGQEEAIENEKAEQRQSTARADQDCRDRVAAAQLKQEHLRAAIRNARAEQDRITKELAEKARRLHSRCIFFENENKRCVSHADAQVVAAGKKEITRLQTDEEEWRTKIAALHTRCRMQHDRERESHKTKEAELVSDHNAELARMQRTAETMVTRTKTTTQDRVASMITDYNRRLDLLNHLNVDSETFIKEAKFVEPRYDALYAGLSAIVARRDRDGAMPRDYENAVACMKSVVLPKRRTATPLAYRADSEDPMGAVLTPRSRSLAPSEMGASEAPTTPRRNGSPSASRNVPPLALHKGHDASANRPGAGDRTNPHSPQSTLMGSTIDFLHAGERPPSTGATQIKSLRPPTKTIAQPTRTSLLRCGMMNYKKPAAGKATQSASVSVEIHTPAAVMMRSGAASPVPRTPLQHYADPNTSAAPPAAADRSTTPTRFGSRSPSRAVGTGAGGVPARSAARSEHRAARREAALDPYLQPVDSEPLEPAGYLHTEESGKVFPRTEEDGTRRKAIYGHGGVVLLSRSKSPARVASMSLSADFSNSAPSPTASTPRRKAQWR